MKSKRKSVEKVKATYSKRFEYESYHLYTTTLTDLEEFVATARALKADERVDAGYGSLTATYIVRVPNCEPHPVGRE